MNQTECIALIRLAKKVYNTQHEHLANNLGYLGMLNQTKPLCIKLDQQLSRIPSKATYHYQWMPQMVTALRKWRTEQELYLAHVAESRMRAAQELELKLDGCFTDIQKHFPEVLSNPNTQTTLL